MGWGWEGERRRMLGTRRKEKEQSGSNTTKPLARGFHSLLHLTLLRGAVSFFKEMVGASFSSHGWHCRSELRGQARPINPRSILGDTSANEILVSFFFAR